MKLGRYEILEELGSGGFGTVYKAEDEVLGRIVALKVLHPGLLIDQNFVSRFRNEARLAAQLDHPNLVPVYDFGEIDGRYLITMAYMAGGSLKKLLAEEGKLSMERTWQILEDVSQGLDYAHGKGIVHRDLKPGNILLDENGHAHVSDLGFARVITDASSLSMSASGGLVGTPAYMAPEVWRNKPASVQTDIYSLGCILYEMLTGEVLFEGTSPAEVMTKHVIDGPQFQCELPAGLNKLFDKCLAMNPRDRYQQVGSILEDYTAFRANLEQKGASPQEESVEAEVADTQEVSLSKSDPGERGQERSEETPVAEEVRAGAPHLDQSKTGEDRHSETEDKGTASAVKSEIDGSTNAADRKKEWLPRALIGFTVIAVLAFIFIQASRQARYSVVYTNPIPTRTPTRTPTQTPSKMILPLHTSFREEDGMEMVYVPAGEFIMGSEDGREDEKPIRQIYLGAYWIDRYEVSNAQYAKCVATGRCTKPSSTGSWYRNSFYGNPQYNDYPVVFVDWYQAKAYCEWAGANLPTEAQWEKAARGTDGRTYPWGNESPNSQLVKYNQPVDNTSPADDYQAGASPYGVLNMAGNVMEWVCDWYGPYKEGDTENPNGPDTGQYRVLRGGAWGDNYMGIRSALRVSFDPTYASLSFGFRCVLPQP